MRLPRALSLLTLFALPCGLLVADMEAPPEDGYAKERSLVLQSEMQAIARKLTPSVICVQAMPDPASNNIERKFGGGGGSGVIIDPEGYALSNFHVTEFGPIMVGMVDGRLHQAKVVAYDECADIVLIKIEGGPFPAVELGDSDAVKEGDLSIAMGNPFGLAVDYKPTVTFGIISGTNRFLPGAGDSHMLLYTGIIQTDTPINPGNSGGPLFNRQGHLLGINGRISLSGPRKVNVGVGYTIPINMIKRFLPSMKAGQDANHGVLGVAMADGEGVEVSKVVRGSPAEKIGIQKGDVIASIQGRKPRDAYEAIHMINGHPAGTELTLTCVRKSPLESGRQESFEAVATLEGRPQFMRLARKAVADKIENFDFVQVTPFAKPGEFQNFSSQVVAKVREVNRDPLDLVSGKDSLLWTVVTRFSADEERFNRQSRGWVSGDQLLFHRGKNESLTYIESYGMTAKGLQIQGCDGVHAWTNGAAELQPAATQSILDADERRALFYGLGHDPTYDLTLEEGHSTMNGRTCHILREVWKGQVQRFHVDKATGVVLAHEMLNEKNDVISQRVNRSFGRIQGKVLPLEWTENQGADPRSIVMFRVHKIASGETWNPMMFSLHPGSNY
ncbi:MAG: S1C family serine protease [Planctomycetota bacterium]